MVKHPAKYHPAILAPLSELVAEERARLGREPAILDPFAGLGKVHELGSNTLGIESTGNFRTRKRGPEGPLVELVDYLPFRMCHVRWHRPMSSASCCESEVV